MARKTVRLMAKWIARAISVLVLGLVLFAVAVLILIPRATHGTALTVLTGSMTPGIPVGSIVVDRPVDPGTLHVGDIATYQVAPGVSEYITHRILKINTATTPVTFTFKGDANRGPDMKPVPANAIRGKVWFHLPYLGAIRDAMHTKGGLAGAGMLVLAVYALVQLAGGLKDRRRPGSNSAATAKDIAAAPESLGAFAEAERDREAPRVMILTTLPTAEFNGLPPQAVNRLLGGILLEVSDDSFTVLVAESASRAQQTVGLIDSFRPLSLQTAVATFRQSGDLPLAQERALRRLRRDDLALVATNG